MKKNYLFPIIIFTCLIIGFGCKKGNPSPGNSATYKQVNLVSDIADFSATRLDVQLVNPWGIAVNPNNGAFWISDNGTGLTSIYDQTGAQLLPAIGIAAPSMPNGGGAASGAVFNSTTDFGGAHFIYATEDGTIAAWKGGTIVPIVVDSSASNAIFKGLAIANDGTGNFIFAADFHNNRVDVFNSTFGSVTDRHFIDPSIPAGFAPFNIQVINGMLYVAYAKQDAEAHDDEKGPGNGYISIFKYDGTFVKRFASQGTLNSPWGILPAPSGFGQHAGAVLVGNFGDGAINVFDSYGNFQSRLKDSTGKVISINGLWGIASLPDNSKLFFTAGPDDESHGIFGYLQMN